MNRLQEIVNELAAKKRSVSCNGKDGLLSYMEELGFQWSKGKTDGHKVFVHPKLSEVSDGRFITHSINCGHAPRQPMKIPYVVSTIRMLNKYEAELVSIIESGE